MLKSNLVTRGALALSLAASAFAADYTAWSGHKTIVLNTTSSGANVAGNVTQFPVLIRLGANESDILNLLGSSHASLRFSKSDNATPLPYQVESWTPTSAAIWVKVDTVYGNNSTQSIRMHYGNGAAASESNGAAVFDTANGFRGVWHLQDSTGGKSSDATFFNTNAMWYNGPVLADGIIGKAVNLTQPEALEPGNARHLRAPYNVANNNFKASSANGITLSVWVKQTANSGGNEQGILGRYNWNSNGRQAMIALNGNGEIRLFRSTNGTNSGGAETNFGTSTIVDGAWTHITATVKNGAQVLYVDGVQTDAQTTPTIGSLDSIWANSSVLAFGRMAPDHANNPVHQAFNGVMDEARYTSVARSADWVKLEYQNQKIINSLVNIGLPTVPAAPTMVSAIGGNTQATVSWTAPASNGGAAITGYKAMAVNDTTKACLTTGATTCTVTGLTNGTMYSFTVKATNGVGTGAASTASAPVTPAPTAPGAPAAVGVIAGARNTASLVVTWTAPGSNGGSAITGYKAMIQSDTAKSCATNGTTLTCTITGLTPGANYSVAVKATNAIGTGPAATSTITAAPLPVNPGALRLSVGRFARDYTFVLPDAAIEGTESLTMTISDLRGREVWSRTLSPAQSKSGTISWNGLASNGRKAPSGLYLVEVTTSGKNGVAQGATRLGVKLRKD